MKLGLLSALLPLQFAAAARGVERSHGRFDILEFKTEPKLRAPTLRTLNITHDRTLLQPGYIILESVLALPTRIGEGTGPLIYDQDGTLIYSGRDLLGPQTTRTANTHVCDYDGHVGEHLCTSEMVDEKPMKRHGLQRIYDKHYRLVASDAKPIREGFKAPQRPDQHEFVVTDNGTTYLRLIYHTKPVDLSPIGGESRSLIEEGCIQEVDAATFKVKFQWCGLDHAELEDSEHFKQRVAHEESDKTQKFGWDWMHANSIDKNEEGDYIISIRYFSQVIKIAGINAQRIHGVEPGTTLWKLGGSSSDIEVPPEVEFEWQHDARFISTGEEETVITLHDNRKPAAETPCNGKMIKINNSTKKAELIQQWNHPEKSHCTGMGSMRILPNGNAFFGWGYTPYVSEFDEAGNLLYHATYAGENDPEEGKKLLNYRSFKQQWVGMPLWKPKVLVYAKSCKSNEAPLVAYVSWNGATEVASWRFSISMFAKSGPWIAAGVFAKDGFETRATLNPKFRFDTQSSYVLLEALDKAGNVLASTTTDTWIPGELDKHDCDDFGCHAKGGFTYDAINNYAPNCAADNNSFTIAAVVVPIGAIAIGAAVWLFRWIRLRRKRAQAKGGDDEEVKEPLLYQ